MQSASSRLRTKLEAFRRKYYLNEILRGSLLLALLGGSLFTALILIEGSLWLTESSRRLLFFTWLAVVLGVISYFIIRPVLAWAKLGKHLSDAAVARLIGLHFPDVQDKLINLLELEKAPGTDNSLLLASIEQRTQQLSPLPFTQAVSFRPTWRRARFVLIPLLILLLLFWVDPQLVSGGTERLIRYNQSYLPPPPFTIAVPNHEAQLVEGASHTVSIEVGGQELPSELYLYRKRSRDLDFQRYALERVSTTRYRFTFENVGEDFAYRIGNDRHQSQALSTDVLARPRVGNFQVILHYPAYTGLGTDTLPANIGDFTALRGTRAEWQFSFAGPVQAARYQGKEPDTLTLSSAEADRSTASLSRQIMTDESYQIVLISPEQVVNSDTIRYRIQAQPDAYPQVDLRSPLPDANLPNTGILPLQALAADDFGFTRAALFFRITRSEDPSKVSTEFEQRPLPLTRSSGKLTEIDQNLDFFELGIAPGDELEFYVQVWDNDQVAGPKPGASGPQTLRYLSQQTQYQALSDSSEALVNQLGGLTQRAQEVRQRLQQAQRRLIDKPNLSFEDRAELQELLQEQRQIEEQMQEATEKLQRNLDEARQNQLMTEETQQKFEQLQEMMREMADSDILKKLQEMMRQNPDANRQELQQQLENMENQSERMEEDIDRTLELFRQLQADQKVQELLQQLENMRQRQDLLKERLERAETSQEQEAIAEQQQELRQEMESVKQNLEELKAIKEQTQTPEEDKLNDLQNEATATQQEMQRAAQELQELQQNQAQQEQSGQKPSKAQQQQQNQQQQRIQEQQERSSQQMQDMQENLREMQFNNELEQAVENYEDLRALLENLLDLSFEQEEVRDVMRGIRQGDPALEALVQRQTKIRDDMIMVEDSLKALANRMLEIKGFVMDQLERVTRSLDQTVGHLDESQVPAASVQQQYAMTGLNTLANQLAELLNSAQENIRAMQGMGSQGKMPKPGMGQGMRGLSQQQRQLNEQLQQMMKGQKPSSQGEQGQSGQNGQEGENGASAYREFAKQQAEIRRQLQELYKRLQEEGQGGLGSLDRVGEQMEASEEDLRNQRLTEELLQRQQQILNRMLDYDKAMREREYGEQRQSQTGQRKPAASPAELTPEELRERIRREQFNQRNFQYEKPYQELIDSYFRSIGA